eukprot:g3842.t1
MGQLQGLALAAAEAVRAQSENVSRLDAELEEKAERVSRLEAALEQKAESESAHAGRVSRLKKQLKEKAESESAHAERVSRLKMQLKEKAESESALAGRVSRLEKQLKEKAESESAHAGRVSRLEKQLKEKAESESAHAERVSRLEKQLKGEAEPEPANASRVPGLAGGLEAELDGVLQVVRARSVPTTVPGGYHMAPAAANDATERNKVCSAIMRHLPAALERAARTGAARWAQLCHVLLVHVAGTPTVPHPPFRVAPTLACAAAVAAAAPVSTVAFALGQQALVAQLVAGAGVPAARRHFGPMLPKAIAMVALGAGDGTGRARREGGGLAVAAGGTGTAICCGEVGACVEFNRGVRAPVACGGSLAALPGVALAGGHSVHGGGLRSAWPALHLPGNDTLRLARECGPPVLVDVWWEDPCGWALLILMHFAAADMQEARGRWQEVGLATCALL